MLSNHVNQIAPSATLAMTGRVAQLRRDGVDIISLNVGEPDFGTPENICRAAKLAIDQQKTKYTPVAGIGELREAICKKLAEDNGVRYSAKEISVGTGAKQPLFNAVFALCGEGDEVIIPAPCWVSYIEMVRLAEATPVLVRNREEQGFALNLEAIEAAITPRTKAVIINTPNNPTGAVYSRSELEKLAELAVKHDFYIISDEVYEKLIYDGREHACVASLSEAARRHTVVINGLSKSHAMTGWRIGYAAADEAIISAINAAQGHMTSNTCSVSQWAAVEALTGPQDSVFTMREEFARRRGFLLDALNHIPGISCVNAQGAFYLMPNIASFYGKRCGDRVINDSFDMANYLIDEARVAVVPGAAFEAPDNLRIAYSNSMANLEEGIRRIKAALSKLQ